MRDCAVSLCSLVAIRCVHLRCRSLGEEGSRQRSRNGFVRRWGLTEVEEVVEIVGSARIGKPEIAETKDTLDRLQDAPEIVFQVADVPGLRRVDGNHHERDPETELIVVLVRTSLEYGPHVVIPASPIVPGNEYGRVFPVAGAVVAICVVSDGIHNGRYPRWPLAAVNRMIGILPRGRDPTYLRERAIGDVVQNVWRRSVDVAVGCAFDPVWPGAYARLRDADVRERVGRYSETILPFRVVSPRDLGIGLVKKVIHGIACEAFRDFVARGFRAKGRS